MGREGEGPGEYQFPLALTAVGDGLVAWDANSGAAFTVLSATGEVLATTPREVEGDWSNPSFREPLINADGVQRGPEDVTRRLQPLGDSGFVHALGLDEFQIDYGGHADWATEATFPWDARPLHLIRYDLDANIRDTLVTLTAPPLELKRARPGVVNAYAEPLYSGRPVWATGAGWLALGHGDSSHVVVQSFEGDTMLTLRWPERRYDVLDREKVAAVEWMVAFRALNSESYRERIERASAAEEEQGITTEALEWRSIADRTPMVTAAYGAGSCLFLAGWAPDDWADGTSLTWIAVDVRDATLEAIFRIPPPEKQGLMLNRNGAAVRDFDGEFAYVTFRDDNGVFLVERHRLPELSCEA